MLISLVHFSCSELVHFYMIIDKNRVQTAFLRLAALVILIFFIFWKSYQSRYILSCLPFLILLSAHFLVYLFSIKSKMNSPALYFVLKSSVLAFLLCAILKVLYVNIYISFPNDLCYF